MRRGLFALLSLAALVSTAAPALAVWPHDPSNSGVQLTQGTNSQFTQQPLADGAGGAFIVWQENVAPGDLNIMAQRLDALGNPLWGSTGAAVCTAPNLQQLPAMCSDGAGGVIVTWFDNRNPGTSGNDIYVQRLNGAGVAQWTANGVAICTANGTQLEPELVSDGAGGAIITWYDQRAGNYDVYAQRVSAAGVPLWAANGVPVCVAANDQIAPMIASDGAGGAFVTWSDLRNGVDNDVYAQRVNGAGVVQWATDGLAIAAAGSDQKFPRVVADGVGGAVLAWQDGRIAGDVNVWAQRITAAGAGLWGSGITVCNASGDQTVTGNLADGTGGAFIEWSDARVDPAGDLYAQHVNGSGVPQWTANGVAICTVLGTPFSATLTSDGAGGIIAAWDDTRSGLGHDVYAQRIDATGTPRFITNGTPVSTAVQDQLETTVTLDGSGGALLAWTDRRSGVTRIYAQRIDHFGELGEAEPFSAGVRDVPHDEGGFVTVAWSASYLDADPVYGVTDYRLWRSAPLAPAAQARARRVVTVDADEAVATGALLAGHAAAQGYAWQYVATAPAAALPTYQTVTATTGDSTGTGNPRTAFMVEARASSAPGAPHWFSAPDSGYSVDNLPPPAPTPFLGTYAAGVAALTWGADPAPDLAGYRLYRGASAAFVPGPSNLVVATPQTAYADAAGAPYYYRLTAIDIHGNESASTLLLPSGALAVDGAALPREVALAAPTPNPARGLATLRFALPRDASVRLALYDAAGRRVRVLAEGVQPAGEHGVSWDLRDDGGHAVGAGLYFARLEADGAVRIQRVAALN